MISTCPMFFSIVCHLFLEWVLTSVVLGTLYLWGKFLCPPAVIDSASLYFYLLQNIEDILGPLSHFSLLLSSLNFTWNRRKQAETRSAMSAISVYVYLLYSGTMISRIGMCPGATF